MKVQRSISVDERLSNRVSELASLEERSFSNMWSVLVEEALAARNGDSAKRITAGGGSPIGPNELGLPESAIVYPDFSDAPRNSESSEQILARPTTAKREKVCVHRVPVGSFCKFGCDG